MFYFYDDDFLMMLVFIFVALFAISIIRRMMSAPKQNASTAASAAKPAAQASSKNKLAEDIKTTKTSQVADAVSILDDLGSTTSTYRHYCELIGTSMASSGVIAPYSKRPVAYYDIKCYRIDATYNGGQTETLVAHEHSFDPFFFTDGSCDTPVYVDLESFGANVILVNSTNHIEGPNSEFSKAAQGSTAAATGRSGTAYAMVAHAAQAGSNVLAQLADRLGQALAPRPALQPAYALACGSEPSSAPERAARGPKVFRSDDDDHDHDRSRGRGRGPQDRSGITIQVGYGGHMPDHLGDFMGYPGANPWVMGGGPSHHHRPTTSNGAEIILGMGLAALLNSMNTTQQQIQQQTSTGGSTFRGYRLVENVVPLGSPIYCIGEIYRHGTDVYMGRSLAKDYPTSYFATKPEAEVLSAIETR